MREAVRNALASAGYVRGETKEQVPTDYPTTQSADPERSEDSVNTMSAAAGEAPSASWPGGVGRVSNFEQRGIQEAASQPRIDFSSSPQPDDKDFSELEDATSFKWDATTSKSGTARDLDAIMRDSIAASQDVQSPTSDVQSPTSGFESSAFRADAQPVTGTAGVSPAPSAKREQNVGRARPAEPGSLLTSRTSGREIDRFSIFFSEILSTDYTARLTPQPK